MAPRWVRGAQLGMAGLAVFLLVFTVQLHTMADTSGTTEDLVASVGGLAGATLLLAGAWMLGRA
jgi:hypothetical protein